MSNYLRAKERYKKCRGLTRELIEEELLHELGIRVDVIGIDDDVLRKVRRQWYENPARQVGWDWETQILQPLLSYGPRTFYAAYLVKGTLCALAAARLSPGKRWISLTHVEGAKNDHPLKGKVLPIVIRSLYVFRGVIHTGGPEMPGIRVLRPLPDALDCYDACGYPPATMAKKDSVIVIEPPTGSK